jgi:hypothetical protein
MEAVRCLQCGETRWALFRKAQGRKAEETCVTCGGRTVVERRHPGAAPRIPFVERRDLRLPRPPSRLAGL